MNLNGKEFFENAGDRKTPVFRWAPEASQVQRSLYVNNNDGSQLAQEDLISYAEALLGWARVQTDAQGPGGSTRRWIERGSPAVYPTSSSTENPFATDWLYCRSVPAAEPCAAPIGLDAGRSTTEYLWYRFHTVWETLDWDVKADDDVLAQEGPLAAGADIFARPDEGDALSRGWSGTRWITKQIQPASQVVSMRQGFVRYALPVAGGVPGDPINEGWPMSVARIAVEYVWHHVPLDGVPFAGIQRCLNCINNAGFDNYPEWTMLLTDAKLRFYRSAFGQRVADVLYRFLYKPSRDPITGTYYGHNAILRVKGGQRRYWPVSTDGYDPLVFNSIWEPVDMSQLFRPDQG